MTNLQDKFNLYISKQKLEKSGSALREFLVKHRDGIRVGVSLSKAITRFVVDKTPLTFVEGAFDALDGIAKHSADRAPSLFSVKNGWKKLFNDNTLNSILAIPLDTFPHRVISFEYDSSLVKIYKTPVGDITYVHKSGEYYEEIHSGIYYKFNEIENKKVIDFLIKNAIKYLDSDIISLNVEDKKNVRLIKEPIDYNESKRLNDFISYLTKSFDLGINRSFIFLGPPGTGKSSLSQSIVKKLKFKTLIYKDGNYNNTNAFFFLIEKLGIEAVILDDFDQIEKSNRLLGMLDRLNRNVKLVIGLVNSMQELHPAVIRPGRFDEIKIIDAMDEDVVHKELNSLNELYFDKVKIWPIAYIKEFVKRSKLYPNEELDSHFKELDERVQKQLKTLASPPQKQFEENEFEEEE